MPLDLLSNIKGARSSEAVNELFKVIQRAVPAEQQDNLLNPSPDNVVSVDGLRNDAIQQCPESEKDIIKKNFPSEKNGYLVVPKVIED